MRTTLDIDGELLKNVVVLAGEGRKGKAVSKALEEYIRRRRIEELRAMLGTIDPADNWYEWRHMELR